MSQSNFLGYIGIEKLSLEGYTKEQAVAEIEALFDYMINKAPAKFKADETNTVIRYQTEYDVEFYVDRPKTDEELNNEVKLNETKLEIQRKKDMETYLKLKAIFEPYNIPGQANG